MRLAIDTISGLVRSGLPDGHIDYLNKRVPAVRQQGSAGFGEAVEQGLYWLIWAVVLVGLALGVFGF